MSTTTALVDKQLASEEWSQGLLPDEGIKTLLVKNGDFVVWMTEPKPGQVPSLVLSVMFNEKAMEDGIRHYSLTQDNCEFVIEKMVAPSVSALVNHHMKTKETKSGDNKKRH